jgi:hypothetical protein
MTLVTALHVRAHRRRRLANGQPALYEACAVFGLSRGIELTDAATEAIDDAYELGWQYIVARIAEYWRPKDL